MDLIMPEVEACIRMGDTPISLWWLCKRFNYIDSIDYNGSLAIAEASRVAQSRGNYSYVPGKYANCFHGAYFMRWSPSPWAKLSNSVVHGLPPSSWYLRRLGPWRKGPPPYMEGATVAMVEDLEKAVLPNVGLRVGTRGLLERRSLFRRGSRRCAFLGGPLERSLVHWLQAQDLKHGRL